MKRLLVALLSFGLLTVTSFTALQGSASAVDIFTPCDSRAGSSAVCKDVSAQGSSDVNPIVTDIKVVIIVLSYIIGVAAVIILIISGIRMVVSNGDAQAVSNARKGVIYALIGLIVASFAQIIVAFVLDKL